MKRPAAKAKTIKVELGGLTAEEMRLIKQEAEREGVGVDQFVAASAMSCAMRSARIAALQAAAIKHELKAKDAEAERLIHGGESA